MNKAFKITFELGYDQADTLIQIRQLESRREQLIKAIKDKGEGRAYDMLLPSFYIVD